jgi:hypothetical protein
MIESLNLKFNQWVWAPSAHADLGQRRHGADIANLLKWEIPRTGAACRVLHRDGVHSSR